MKNSKRMNIVYTSSDYYSSVMYVSMYSLLKNNPNEDIRFFIIENKIQEDNKAAIIDLVNHHNSKVEFIKMPNFEKMLKLDLNKNQVDLCVYSTCFLPSLLPDNIDRVLYLDCDTLINGEITDLYHLDMKDNILAGADDLVSVHYKRKAGLKKHDPYINAGVLLIDIKEWRKKNIEQLFIDALKRCNGKVMFMDQGILNSVISPNILVFSNKYNLITSLVCFNYKSMILYRNPSVPYSQSEFNNVMNEPIIIHFTNNIFMYSRPWEEKCNHPFKELYLNYRNETIFKDAPLYKPKPTARKRFVMWFYKTFPKRVTAFVFRIFQSFLYPVFVCRKTK